jgi:hypothetical protein
MQVIDVASGFGFLAIKLMNYLGLRPENALLRTRFFVTFLAMKKVKKKWEGDELWVLISHGEKEKTYRFEMIKG